MAASPEQRIEILDPIRGIAILMVFVFHSLGAAFGQDHLAWAEGSWWRSFAASPSFLSLLPVTFGWAGVAVFFVVSGFCIHFSFARRPDWRGYFRRRFFRIYPPYLAVLLFFALLCPTSRLRFASWQDAGQLLSHIGLLHNLGETTFFGINPSFWSIAVEAQLYLLYPFLLSLARRFTWPRALLILGLVEAALRLTDGLLFAVRGTGLPIWLAGSPLTFWFSWSLGACLAERHLNNEKLVVPRGFVWILALAVVVSKLVKPLSSLPFLFAALLAAAAMAGLMNRPDRELPLPGFLNRHLRKAGVWSFSLYLLHQPLLHLVTWGTAKAAPGVSFHPLVLFVFCLSTWFLMLPLARLCYRYGELPSIALGRRLQQP